GVRTIAPPRIIARLTRVRVLTAKPAKTTAAAARTSALSPSRTFWISWEEASGSAGGGGFGVDGSGEDHVPTPPSGGGGCRGGGIRWVAVGGRRPMRYRKVCRGRDAFLRRSAWAWARMSR